MELAANAALENYRARFNRVFDVGSDNLYRKGLHFNLPRAAKDYLRAGSNLRAGGK